MGTSAHTAHKLSISYLLERMLPPYSHVYGHAVASYPHVPRIPYIAHDKGASLPPARATLCADAPSTFVPARDTPKPPHQGGFLTKAPRQDDFLDPKVDQIALYGVWFGVKTTTPFDRRNTMAHRTHTHRPVLEAAQAAWECYLVRLAILAAALGAVPFYFLSLAVAALGGN